MLKGIVICNVSNLYHIEAEDGKTYICNARGKFKNNEVSPVAGDRVEIEVIDTEMLTGVINKIEDRINYIKRPKMANLTQIILVVSMKLPKPDLVLLDKQLVYSEYMNIKPVICLNKIDLEDENNILHIEEIYRKIGYTVLRTNAKEGTGVEDVPKLLNGKITAFSGNSGVGKSTLINSIFKKDVTQEGVISQKNKRGKNTTTQVNLYKIENGTYIADTPGFASFDIYEIDSSDLCKYFIEFLPYIEKCEFVGCSHIKEQNCGIKKAVEEGMITQERYDRYCKIYEDLKTKEAKRW